MNPVEPPAKELVLFPNAVKINVGPPAGIGLDECGIAKTLRDVTIFGGSQTYDWMVYFKPSDEDLSVLNSGGLVRFSMLGYSEVPHSAAVVEGD